MATKRSQGETGTTITITRVYHPDLQRQLQALRVLLDASRQRVPHFRNGQAVVGRLGEDQPDMTSERRIAPVFGDEVPQ